jgi:hypothetical protein
MVSQVPIMEPRIIGDCIELHGDVLSRLIHARQNAIASNRDDHVLSRFR